MAKVLPGNQSQKDFGQREGKGDKKSPLVKRKVLVFLLLSLVVQNGRSLLNWKEPRRQVDIPPDLWELPWMCVCLLSAVIKKMGQLKREHMVLDFHHSGGSGNAFISPQIYG